MEKSRFPGVPSKHWKQAKPAIRQDLQSHDSSRVLLLRWGSAEIVKGKHSYTTTSIDSVKWNDEMTGTPCPPGNDMKITGTRSPPMKVGPLFFVDGFLQSNMLQGFVSKDMYPRSNPTQIRARVYLETGKVQNGRTFPEEMIPEHTTFSPRSRRLKRVFKSSKPCLR